jgi:hypothetical protein
MVDTVIVNAPKGEEDPKHVQEMIDVVDQANAAAAEQADSAQRPDAEPQPEDRPSWLPEKFKSPEDLAKAYSELESKLGKKEDPKPAEEAPKPEEGDPKPETPPTQEQAREELNKRGLELDKYNEEWAKTGQLSEESFKELEDAGLSRATVETFIAGQKALAAQFETEVKSIAGGDEGFSGMVEWARVNADPKEVAAYNKAIDSGDIAAAKLAVAGMYQKYLEARPNEGKLVTGSNGKPGADVYESVEDYIKDASNPEYKTNPAFRNRVIAKLGRSNVL